MKQAWERTSDILTPIFCEVCDVLEPILRIKLDWFRWNPIDIMPKKKSNKYSGKTGKLIKRYFIKGRMNHHINLVYETVGVYLLTWVDYSTINCSIKISIFPWKNRCWYLKSIMLSTRAPKYKKKAEALPLQTHFQRIALDLGQLKVASLMIKDSKSCLNRANGRFAKRNARLRGYLSSNKVGGA